jgi:hypothetical protein
MRQKPTYFVQSPGPGANLSVGKGFSGDLHVHGSWQNIEVHGGNVTIGGELAAVRAALGLSLSEPSPAAAYRWGDLLVLLGTDSASYRLEIGRTRSRRFKKKRT